MKQRPIYATPFDPETKQCTGPSSDSGFDSLNSVVMVLGPDYVSLSARNVIYDGVIYSDFKLHVDESVTSA